MKIKIMRMLAAAACAWLAGTTPAAHAAAIPVLGYRVVHTYPHDPAAFTEGLFYDQGYLYESTGEYAGSGVRRTQLETGKVTPLLDTPGGYFGEGIIFTKDHLLQLTWRDQVGFIYDRKTFRRIGEFHYPGEGWAMTRDAKHIYMSDGTPTIRILDPATLEQTGHIDVTADGQPLQLINELEWVKGAIYANVWQTDRIARIDPATGHVTAWIDLAGIIGDKRPHDTDAVLNGIAFDPVHDRLFVTGKLWPSVFEIRLTPAP